MPAMGRFLSPDPIEGGSANDYEYAAGDPVNNFDLTGTKCIGSKWWVSRCKAARQARQRHRAVGRGVGRAVVQTRKCTAIACTNGWPSGGHGGSLVKFLTKVANTAVDYMARGTPTDRNVRQHIRSIYGDAGSFFRRHAFACAAGAVAGWNATWLHRKEDPLYGHAISGVAAGTECVASSVG